jgi:hypothetical protein
MLVPWEKKKITLSEAVRLREKSQVSSTIAESSTLQKYSLKQKIYRLHSKLALEKPVIGALTRSILKRILTI